MGERKASAKFKYGIAQMSFPNEKHRRAERVHAIRRSMLNDHHNSSDFDVVQFAMFLGLSMGRPSSSQLTQEVALAEEKRYMKKYLESFDIPRADREIVFENLVKFVSNNDVRLIDYWIDEFKVGIFQKAARVYKSQRAPFLDQRHLRKIIQGWDADIRSMKTFTYLAEKHPNIFPLFSHQICAHLNRKDAHVLFDWLVANRDNPNLRIFDVYPTTSPKAVALDGGEVQKRVQDINWNVTNQVFWKMPKSAEMSTDDWTRDALGIFKDWKSGTPTHLWHHVRLVPFNEYVGKLNGLFKQAHPEAPDIGNVVIDPVPGGQAGGAPEGDGGAAAWWAAFQAEAEHDEEIAAEVARINEQTARDRKDIFRWRRDARKRRMTERAYGYDDNLHQWDIGNPSAPPAGEEEWGVSE